MFYTENAGSNIASSTDNYNHTNVGHGMWAYHSIKRFVVVKNRQNDPFSYCWWVKFDTLFVIGLIVY